MILKKKALLVVGGVLAGLWLLERRARAAASSSSGAGTSTGASPGSSVGICVEDEDGNTACGGDVPVGGYGGIVPAVILHPPVKPEVYTKPAAPTPIYTKPVHYETLGKVSTTTWPDPWNTAARA